MSKVKTNATIGNTVKVAISYQYVPHITPATTSLRASIAYERGKYGCIAWKNGGKI